MIEFGTANAESIVNNPLASKFRANFETALDRGLVDPPIGTEVSRARHLQGPIEIAIVAAIEFAAHCPDPQLQRHLAIGLAGDLRALKGIGLIDEEITPEDLAIPGRVAYIHKSQDFS